MPEGTAAAASPARPASISISGALRFLVTDRFGLLLLFWGLIAFAARPAFLAAHDGAMGWPYENIRAAFPPVALALAVLMWRRWSRTRMA